MKIRIPYGKRFLEFFMPSDRMLGILKNNRTKHSDIRKLVSESLDTGPNRIRLNKILSGQERVLIVVPDLTRKAHLEEILPEFLKRIKARPISIDIIVATGLHKKHSSFQLRELLGGVVLKRCRVLNHEQKAAALMRLGLTKRRVPIVLNKILKDYDSIISVGLIEPHLYAGYSGGAKTVAIGLAGEETINATHSMKFLDDPLTKLGSIERNPFQEALQEIIAKVHVGFFLNVVNDPEGRPLKIFAGTLKEVFEKGVAFAKGVFEIEVHEEAGLAVCGIGYPKDVNLYQASRAINYVLNVDRPVLRKGGVLVIVGALDDGIGMGVSERRFYSELRTISSPEKYVRQIKRSGCEAGAHRAYMVARPLSEYKVIFVTSGKKDFMRGLPFACYGNIDEALRRAFRLAGGAAKAYVIPHALSTIATRC